jgi:lipid A 3-O-deacylase
LKRLVLGLLFAGALVTGPAAWSDAVARARTYDVNYFLGQPHPFAGQPPPAVHRPVPQMPIRSPARVPQPSSRPRYVQPKPAPSGGRMTAAAVARMARHGDQPNGLGFLSEIRLGVLNHDEGPFSRNEEDGIDGNLELLFVSPRFLDIIWAPRPHLGVDVNSSGDTSQVYLGLTWEWRFWRAWFANFSLGAAVHNGKLKTNRIDRKELGCRVLFRESAEMGYLFAGRHGVSLFLDHLSNAGICTKNEGLENFGLRYGYRF